MENPIMMFTDGSSIGNPGPGGYGVVLRFGHLRKELSKGYRLTTNNRMELLAVIEGLKALKKPDALVHIYSDSKYVVSAVNEKWVWGWKKNGFKGKKNVDLWKEFLLIYPQFRIKFIWVKGHAGHTENERCDFLATSAAAHPQAIDEGFENQNNDTALGF